MTTSSLAVVSDDGTSYSARLYPQRPPLILAFCALSLIGKLLLFSLYLKFAQFLYEFHDFRFESLELPLLPADRSDFDVHGSLEDTQVS